MWFRIGNRQYVSPICLEYGEWDLSALEVEPISLLPPNNQKDLYIILTHGLFGTGLDEMVQQDWSKIYEQPNDTTDKRIESCSIGISTLDLE